MKAPEAACPSAEVLMQAVNGPVDAGVGQHIQGCARCTAELADARALIAQAREIPLELPDEERIEELRTRLLLKARSQPLRPRPSNGRGRRTWAQVGALLAAAALLVGLGVRGLRPRSGAGKSELALRHGTVHGIAGSSYVHGGHPQDEIVRLSEGAILIEVSPLSSGERFRVIVGQSEVEVRGTLFEVVAAHDALRLVKVYQGRVEVRPERLPGVVLSGGERWQAPEAESPKPAEPIASPHPAVPPPQPPPSVPPPSVPPLRQESGATSGLHRKPAAHPLTRSPAPAVVKSPAHPPVTETPRTLPPASPASPTPTEAEVAFAVGWQALRDKRYEQAAAQFQRAAVAAGSQPLAEDARYWHCISLARTGNRAQAKVVLRQFLQRYPRSLHHGELASVLGWMLFDDKRLDEAESLFKSAEDDHQPEVQKSARSGLEEIRQLRTSGSQSDRLGN